MYVFPILVALSGLPQRSPALSQVQPKGVTAIEITNDSDLPLVAIQVRPDEKKRWGPNVLIRRIPVHHHDVIRIRLEDHDVHFLDVRFILKDGTTSEVLHFDVHEESDLTWSWSTTGDD